MTELGRISSMRASDRAGRTSHRRQTLKSEFLARPCAESPHHQSWDNRGGLGRVYRLSKEPRDLVIQPNQYPSSIEMDAETQEGYPKEGNWSAVLCFRGIDLRGTNFQKVEPVEEKAITCTASVNGGKYLMKLTTRGTFLNIDVNVVEAAARNIFSGKYNVSEPGMIDPESMRVCVTNSIVTVTYEAPL